VVVGAVTANIILTFSGILLAILITVVATLPDFNIVLVVGTASAIAVLGPALFYPISFTLWQAIDLWMRGADA